jgi:hypothetical protein
MLVLESTTTGVAGIESVLFADVVFFFMLPVDTAVVWVENRGEEGYVEGR